MTTTPTSSHSTPPSIGSPSRVKRPWESPHAFPVKWEQRTYGLNLKSGQIVVMYEEWYPDYREDGTYVGMAAKRGTLQNSEGYPTLTHGQAAQVFDMAEREDIPLKIAFLKIHGVDQMTPAKVEILALAPEFWVEKPAVEAPKNPTFVKERLKAMLEQVLGEEEPETETVSEAPEIVKRRPGRPRKTPIPEPAQG